MVTYSNWEIPAWLTRMGYGMGNSKWKTRMGWRVHWDTKIHVSHTKAILGNVFEQILNEWGIICRYTQLNIKNIISISLLQIHGTRYPDLHCSSTQSPPWWWEFIFVNKQITVALSIWALYEKLVDKMEKWISARL